MTLKEIEQIKTPIEKEVFIHGALCISYSGECLMSSMLGSRSGNRGECVGSCRLPYTLERRGRIVQKEKYLLSTKELNTAPRFRELLDSSITSFKIEGRMKSPYYVATVINDYRRAIDAYLEEKKSKKDKANWTHFVIPSFELTSVPSKSNKTVFIMIMRFSKHQ